MGRKAREGLYVFFALRHVLTQYGCTAGLVRLDFGNGRYLVEDVTGYSERVWREDIIRVDDDLGKRYVIALHPHHQFRY